MNPNAATNRYWLHLTDGALTFKRTATNNKAENVGSQATVTMSNGDYVELWVANSSAAADITVADLNLAIASRR
jgi:hypothetical protein